MKETVQEYVQRMRNLMAGKNPTKVQAATAKKLQQLDQACDASKAAQASCAG